MTTVALLRGRKMRLAHASIRDGFSSSLHRIGDVADVLKADQVVRTTFLLTELFLTKSSHGRSYNLLDDMVMVCTNQELQSRKHPAGVATELLEDRSILRLMFRRNMLRSHVVYTWPYQLFEQQFLVQTRLLNLGFGRESTSVEANKGLDAVSGGLLRLL